MPRVLFCFFFFSAVPSFPSFTFASTFGLLALGYVFLITIKYLS